MPGTPHGTGQPLTFKCSMCRREYGSGKRRRDDWGRNIKRTGRTQGQVLVGRESGNRMTTLRHEFVCLDCGHYGWSRHVGIETFPVNVKYADRIWAIRQLASSVRKLRVDYESRLPG